MLDKHVYVEKPLALAENEGRDLVRIAEEKKMILMVGHILQYHPAFIRLKEIVASGELGRINYIYSHRLNLGKIRREENILWSFAPHDISMILTLAGELPESVFATGGNYLHNKIADVTTTHISFPSGLKAHIFVSWLNPFKVQRLVVMGDKKVALFDDTLPWQEKLLLYPHQINWQNSIPVPLKTESERVVIKKNEPLLIVCEHFLSCIKKGMKPLTDGIEAIHVLKILNACQNSLDADGCRIMIEENSAEDLSLIDEEDFFIHKTAILEKNCTIGAGTKIWHFSHILPGSKIGENCSIGQNVVIGPDVTIGSMCKIQNNVSVYRGINLEDGVFCGPSMVFTNVYNPRAEIQKMNEVRPTFVKRGATIGANATIICGTTIGSYSFIGAGAVVTKSVKDYSLVVGNPARHIGWTCKCGERLSEDLVCLFCEKKYIRLLNGIKPEHE
jgi:UDP-2-acetamido-3-amino-2,3-dideoxy-glucuronate N-acetyltransferase